MSLSLNHEQVEPAERAYKELGVQSVITGRRASQGAARAGLQPLEVDGTGLLKLNPLCTWNFHLVQWYIDEEKVPTNALLGQGYRSVGDWHSTAKAGDGDAGERAGRWAGRDEKTECGLHVDHLKMRAAANVRVNGSMSLSPADHLAKKLEAEQAQNGEAASSQTYSASIHKLSAIE
jgi:phosphoadenosine phosphosulfate reductase